MKIKLNSFAAAISVVFMLFTAASLFIRMSYVSTTPMLWFSSAYFNPKQPLISLFFNFVFLAAPFLQLALVLLCKRCALPSLLVPLCCSFASVIITLIDNCIIRFFSLYDIILAAVFALLIVFCIILYKNMSKITLSIIFFLFALAIIVATPFGLYKYLNIDILLYWVNMFLSLGALSLCLEPKQKHFELPSLLEAEQPDVSVRIESVSLSQTLDALLEGYNSGKISREEYEALKRETLWKV